MADQQNKQAYYYGTGRRKSAVARVRIIPKGSGKITVNDKPQTTNPEFIDPLTLVGQVGNVDVTVRVNGGGSRGQIEAIRHGIARALVASDEALHTTLKKAGYLTRDPREKERKKFGLKAARRSPQWSKR